MEDLAHGDKKASERERRGRGRQRGGGLSPGQDRTGDAAHLAARGDDQASFALGVDGTRLFVRTRTAGHAPGEVHAFFSDGILCDGFIWKYLWDDLAPTVPLVH